MKHGNFQNQRVVPKPTVSVVIIARDEAAHLPQLLARLQKMPQIAQIVLSDGASRDATIEVARAAGVLVVEGVRGRGAQLNAGAQAANGEILWFLHADALPSRGCGADIMRAIESGAIGGHFRLKFAAKNPKMRVWATVFSQIARFQARFGTFYGDSGIWMTRAAFQNLGGFQNWPLFEDLEMARRLRKIGKIVACPSVVRVSARRFEKRPARVLWLWLQLQLRFDWGQSPAALAQIYRKKSGKS